ncbi:MAG: hypothetical protein Kow0042_16900 [Calditrichia bacterium]
MKTFYKKVLIIGGATLLFELIIIYFLYTSINAFYADLANKLAFLLVEQVRDVIKADKLDLSTLSPYTKYPTRRLMNRFSGEDSKILHILLIDTTGRIVVSDDPSVEGKTYTSPRELNLLRSNQPTIVNREWEGNQEILDVIYPLIQDTVTQGYLRTVISVKHLENFYKNRKLILIAASMAAFAIIILTVFLTSQIYKGHLRHIEDAIERLQDSDYQYRLKYQKQDEFSSVFSRLNELFEKTLDLNVSFHQSEKRIEGMMRVIHEGLLILDEDMRIVSFNDYLLDILHIQHQHNAEDQIYRIIQENPKILELYRRARDPLTHSVRKDLSLKLNDNKTVAVQINALSLSDGKSPRNIIFYIKNIELLQELEQILHRSMRYTVISQLASSIGHEIRNPLSSLAIHTEVIANLTKTVDTTADQQRKFQKSIKILNSEIERLTKLIDQFFGLAKPRELILSLEDMNSIINEVLELVQQEAYEKAVQIRTHFSKNISLVNVSRDQIKQVLINLIFNAFDAMPDGGELFIATSERDDRVVVAIKDTGQGIPPQIQRKIFDLYFSTKENGAGIGLAISKKIIEVHEGKIYFKSQVGQGTRFVIELPRAQAIV